MLKVTSLGSGSSGNALLIRTPRTVLLVDCGIGVRRFSRALESHGLGLTDVDALLITHEHSDHVRELPRFLAAGKPIFCTAGSSRATSIPAECWQESRPGRAATHANIEIVAIAVAHDAVDPCGFLVRTEFGSITVLTDLGSQPAAAAEAIAESRLVVLEANHDEALLRRGPYPAHLQRRILSDSGHLSNTACGELLATALRRSLHLPTIWLAHLSETNNRPHLAKQTVARRLAQDGVKLDLHALPRRDVGATWQPDAAKPGVAQLTLNLPSMEQFDPLPAHRERG